MVDDTHTVKVLYVEDDKLCQNALSFVLKAEKSLEIRTAYDGQAGIDIALKWKPDLILMDLNMPVMDGFEAARALRVYPQTQHIPIVAFSDAIEAGTGTRAKMVGMNGLEEKTFSLTELRYILQTYIAE